MLTKYSACLLFLFSTVSFTQHSITTDEKSGKPMIVGICGREVFRDTAFAQWWDTCYTNYEPDVMLLDRAANDLKGARIAIVMATWCPDSRLQVPRFMKLLDFINFPADSLSLMCVDRKKNGIKDEVSSLKIELVPTFIFYLNNIEIGRIVESPATTLELEILKIFNKK